MMTDNTVSLSLTALVMAASRQGVDDPVAMLQDKSHKCLVEIDGIAMIDDVRDPLCTFIDDKRRQGFLLRKVLLRDPICQPAARQFAAIDASTSETADR